MSEQIPSDKLDPANRWIKLAGEINWEELEEIYKRKIQIQTIHPFVSARTVIAALIVKYKLQVKSEEVITLISENPYLRYFTQTENGTFEQHVSAGLLRLIRDMFGREEWKRFKKIILADPTSASYRFKRIFLLPKKINIGRGISSSYEYEHSHKSRAERRTERRKKKIKKKLLKIGEYLIWIIIAGLIIGSMITLVYNGDIFQDSRAKQNKDRERIMK